MGAGAVVASAPPFAAVAGDMDRGGGTEMEVVRTSTAGGRAVFEQQKARAAMKALAL
eukprot:COSAG02_NODE_2633_length_8375_cov_11.706501_3_plen_57_part_00